MSLSQMQVFNKYYMAPTIETLNQMINAFNGQSNGAIRLTAAGFEGDYMQQSMWNALHSARRRVNRYAAQAAAAATDATQMKNSAVKVAGGFGPVRYEPGQLSWLNKPTTELIEAFSRSFAEALMQDQVNTAIAALVGAISNQVTATKDLSATNGVTQAGLNSSHALFGDQSSRLIAQVMSGAVYHKLIGQAITNATQLFQAGGVTVVSILNKQVIVTDAPALFLTGTPNKEFALSLSEGAATVFDGGDIISNIQTTNGQTRIETTIQADYTFGVALKGYTWDEANGGKSPTDAALATGTNWDKTATDIKSTAGVVLVGDQAKN